MTVAAELPKPFPRWRWLGRWLEPPWRALLTWVVLAGLVGLVIGLWEFEIDELIGFTFEKLSSVVPLPSFISGSDVLSICNYLMMLFWFEPIVLRLNLWRAIAWLGLRMLPFLLVFPFDVKNEVAMLALAICGWSGLTVLVLKGWRTRPWMSCVGGVGMAGMIAFVLNPLGEDATWPWCVATSLPYAEAVLFGTRRVAR